MIPLTMRQLETKPLLIHGCVLAAAMVFAGQHDGAITRLELRIKHQLLTGQQDPGSRDGYGV